MADRSKKKLKLASSKVEEALSESQQCLSARIRGILDETISNSPQRSVSTSTLALTDGEFSRILHCTVRNFSLKPWP